MIVVAPVVEIAFNEGEIQQSVFQLLQQNVGVLLHHVKLDLGKMIHQLGQHRGHQTVRNGKSGPKAQSERIALAHFPGNLLIQRGQTAAELGQSLPLRGERQPPSFLYKQLYPIG